MAMDIQELRNPALRKFADDHLVFLSRVASLGTPVVADVDLVVTTTNMINGAYTVDAQPDITRNITVSATAAGAADTPGTITVVGTNYDGVTISEIIIPSAGSTVAGELAFATVTSVTGAGWVIDEGNDTITIGVGDVLGLPFKIAAEAEIVMGVLGTAIIYPTVTAGTLENSTVDLSASTYDGSKKALAFAVE